MKVVDLLNELQRYPGDATVKVNAKGKKVGDLFTVDAPAPAPLPEDEEAADVTS